MSKASRETRFFDELYAATPDPWGFETSDYEREKYGATLAMLGEARFASAFEVGCSIGVLTERLAGRCDAVLAVDVASAALARAQARCAGLPHVMFGLMRVPEVWPDQKFDLILLSEVLYFLSSADVRAVARQARETLLPGGCVLLVNFLGEVEEACGGGEAAEIFIEAAGLPVLRAARTETYRIDLLQDLSKVSTTSRMAEGGGTVAAADIGEGHAWGEVEARGAQGDEGDDGLRGRFAPRRPKTAMDVFAPNVAIECVQLVVMRGGGNGLEGFGGLCG